MHRLKDYAGFGIWLIGLSYIAVVAVNGPLLGARAVTVPLWLHLLGLLAAIAVFVRLLLLALRSTRTSPAAGKPPRRRRRPEPTVKRVKARDHFGLRGMERGLERGMER
jgi:hypothetical protein